MTLPVTEADAQQLACEVIKRAGVTIDPRIAKARIARQGPTEAELAAERDLADEPKTPIGRGAYQFIPVRYDE